MIKKNKVLVMCQKYPPVYSGYGNQAKSVFNSIVKSSNTKFIVLTADYSDSKKIEGKEINVKTFGRRGIIDKYDKVGLISYSVESFLDVIKCKRIFIDTLHKWSWSNRNTFNFSRYYHEKEGDS